MASRSLNKVMLIGNLTRDPELRYTPQGTAVCSFGLATNRTWVSDGQPQEDVEFHRIVAWQKLAELCSQLLFKGRKVFVGGRLQTRKWTGRDGQERQTTEVVIDNMLILDAKRKEGEAGEVPGTAAGVTVSAEDTLVKPQESEKKPEEKPASKAVAAEKGKGKKGKAEKEGEEKEAAPIKAAVDKPADKDEEEKVSADDIPF